MTAVAESQAANAVNRKLIRWFLIWWAVVAFILLVVDGRAWEYGGAVIVLHAAPPLAPILIGLSQPGAFDMTGWLLTALTAAAWGLAVSQPQDAWLRFIARVAISGYWFRWLFVGLLV